MSLVIITTCDNITICESINDGSVFDYAMRVMKNFEESKDITMTMIINVCNKLITIKLK